MKKITLIELDEIGNFKIDVDDSWALSTNDEVNLLSHVSWSRFEECLHTLKNLKSVLGFELEIIRRPISAVENAILSLRGKSLTKHEFKLLESLYFIHRSTHTE